MLWFLRFCNVKYFILMTALLVLESYGQGYIWTKTPTDGAGNPLFNGGYNARSLINFVDIDGDGDEDIFFLAAYDGGEFYLHFYENIGNADSAQYQFVTDKYSPYSYYYGYYCGSFPPMTTFADIDNDNDYDLFIASGEELRLYENSGDARNPVFDWDNYVVVLSAATDFCIYPTFADIDNDGDLDLFLEHLAKIRFYRNMGNAANYNFVLETTDLFPEYTCHGNMELCDIDNDNDLDAFFNVSNPYNVFKFCYFENTGDSTNFNFQLENEHYFSFNMWEEPELKWVNAHNIDNDSDQDFFIGFIDGPIYEYLNIGTPDSAIWNIKTKSFLDIDVRFISYPRLVDIDNDGDLDLFTSSSIGSLNPQITGASPLWFFENTGDVSNPVFEYRTALFDSIDGVTQIYFSDIDADEDYDLFTGNTEPYNRVRFYRNIGTADSASFFLEDSGIVQVHGYGTNGPAPILADIDNDGDQDMLVSERLMFYPEPGFNFFRNIGDSCNPVWHYESDDFFNLPYGTYDVWDYDKDGDFDLVHACDWYSGGYARVILNTGTPDSAIYTSSVTLDSLFLDPFIYGHGSITFADIDNDGDDDIFMGNELGGIFFYRNDGLVGLKNSPPIVPADFELYQNFPNPFNSSTSISFSTKNSAKIQLEVLNLLGQHIRTLLDKKVAAGIHRLAWNGKDRLGHDVSSGIYILRLKIESNGSQTFIGKKMMLIK